MYGKVNTSENEHRDTNQITHLKIDSFFVCSKNECKTVHWLIDRNPQANNFGLATDRMGRGQQDYGHHGEISVIKIKSNQNTHILFGV